MKKFDIDGGDIIAFLFAIMALLAVFGFLETYASMIIKEPVAQEIKEYKSTAQKAVEAQGFTDVKIGEGSGNSFFMCSDSDSFINSERFTAKNINGVQVDGVVCCGWFKGCTVRF
jgi:hypothetical protein